MKKRRGLEKRAIVIDTLIWWIIAISVLVILIVLAVILKDKLWSIGEHIKNLFRGN